MRKVKLLSAADLIRITMGFEINSREDGYLLSVVLVWVENLLEKYFNEVDGILNLFSNTPLWLELLGKAARTKWATRFAQRNPIEAATLGVFLTGARQYSAQLVTAQFAEGARGVGE